MKKILVVGAGIAGLSAAMRLTDSGFSVRLIESRKFPGGRFFSFREAKTGEILDNGRHVAISAYENFFELTDFLDAKDLFAVQKSKSISFYRLDGKRFSFKTGGDSKLGSALALMKSKGFSMRSKFAFADFASKISKLQSIENESAVELLRRNRQNSQLIENFWEPFVLATMNAPIERASAKILLSILKKTLAKDPGSLALMFCKTHFSRAFGKMEQAFADRDFEIRLGERVEKLEFENDRFTGANLANGDRIEADACVCAVSPDAANRILPGGLAERANLNKFRFSPIVSAYFHFDRPITGFDYAALLGGSADWIFNSNSINERDPEISEKYPGLVSITSSAAFDLIDKSAEEIKDTFLSQIRSAIPRLAESALLSYKILKDKKATILIDPETEKLRPNQSTSVPNFFLAGDYTATELPATLESAAASGKLAADYVRDFFSL